MNGEMMLAAAVRCRSFADDAVRPRRRLMRYYDGPLDTAVDYALRSIRTRRHYISGLASKGHIAAALSSKHTSVMQPSVGSLKTDSLQFTEPVQNFRIRRGW